MHSYTFIQSRHKESQFRNSTSSFPVFQIKIVSLTAAAATQYRSFLHCGLPANINRSLIYWPHLEKQQSLASRFSLQSLEGNKSWWKQYSHFDPYCWLQRHPENNLLLGLFLKMITCYMFEHHSYLWPLDHCLLSPWYQRSPVSSPNWKLRNFFLFRSRPEKHLK